jgi:hypothetical protein
LIDDVFDNLDLRWRLGRSNPTLGDHTACNSNPKHVKPALGEIEEVGVEQGADNVLRDHDET